MNHYYKTLNRIRFLNEKKLEIKELTLRAKKYLIDTKVQTGQEQIAINTAANRMEHHIQYVFDRERNFLREKFQKFKDKMDVIAEQIIQQRKFEPCYKLFRRWVDVSYEASRYLKNYAREVKFRQEVMKLVPAAKNSMEVSAFLKSIPDNPIAMEKIYNQREIASLTEYYNFDEASFKVRELEIEVKEELLKLYTVTGDIKSQLYSTNSKHEEIQFQIKHKYEEDLAAKERSFNHLIDNLLKNASDLKYKFPYDNYAFPACEAWYQYDVGRKSSKDSVYYHNRLKRKKEYKEYWKLHMKSFKTSWFW
jgi:hypothetical protein